MRSTASSRSSWAAQRSQGRVQPAVPGHRPAVPDLGRRLQPDQQRQVPGAGPAAAAGPLDHQQVVGRHRAAHARPVGQPVPAGEPGRPAGGERLEHPVDQQRDRRGQPVPAGTVFQVDQADAAARADRRVAARAGAVRPEPAGERLDHGLGQRGLARAAAAVDGQHPGPARARQRGQQPAHDLVHRPAHGRTLRALYSGPVTVAVRVIPCLDVDAGRVVKGVNFVDLRDAGDPVELAAALRRRGRRRADLPGRHRVLRRPATTTYDVVRRTAEQVFIPLTVGGGVRSVGRRRPAAAGRRRQGRRQHRGDRPAGADRRDRRPVRRPGAGALGGRPALPATARAPTSGFEVTTHGGRRGTGIDAVEWAAPRRPSSARARSCSTRWTPTAPRTASTSS